MRIAKVYLLKWHSEGQLPYATLVRRQPQADALPPPPEGSARESVSPGYERVRIRMTVKADCPDEQLDELLAYTQQHSPVCNTVCRPVPVTIERVGG